MAAADDIRASLDLDQVARYLGTDRATADAAVTEALESLVGAMGGNASDADGALSLTRALGDHVGSRAYGDVVDIDGVDTADGAKIVDHVYGPQQVQRLGGSSGGGLLQKLLPILAPIVMAYLAGKVEDYLAPKSGRATQQPPASQPSGGGGLGDLLGDLFGGGRSAGTGASGGGLGDILGDLLGGGAAAPSPAPQQPQSSGRTTAPGTGGAAGPFRTPDLPDTGVRMDDAQAPASPGAPASQGAGAGDVLGGLLKDILFGRR